MAGSRGGDEFARSVLGARDEAARAMLGEAWQGSLGMGPWGTNIASPGEEEVKQEEPRNEMHQDQEEERAAGKAQHAPDAQPLLDRGEGEQGARTHQREKQAHSNPRERVAESRMLEQGRETKTKQARVFAEADGAPKGTNGPKNWPLGQGHWLDAERNHLPASAAGASHDASRRQEGSPAAAFPHAREECTSPGQCPVGNPPDGATGGPKLNVAMIQSPASRKGTPRGPTVTGVSTDVPDGKQEGSAAAAGPRDWSGDGPPGPCETTSGGASEQGAE